jgi:transcriptional regulator with XRE-family HTH domain
VAREPFEPIDDVARRLIRAALRRKGLNQSELAGRIGVDRSTISKIVRGPGGATISTLDAIARELEIPPERLHVQYELDFEIDEKFTALAQEALASELSRLRADVGRIRARRVTGTIGVRFHGFASEQRVFERVFPLRVPRGARGSASK